MITSTTSTENNVNIWSSSANRQRGALQANRASLACSLQAGEAAFSYAEKEKERMFPC